jgi:uncharacterized protein YcfL
MTKALVIPIAFLLASRIVFAQSEPLISTIHVGETTLRVSVSADLNGSLVSDVMLAKLSEEDKGRVQIYFYNYWFENKGTEKIKFTLADRRVLMSPLTDAMKDLTFTLKPGESRQIRFIANTKPNSVEVSAVVMRWKDETQEWRIDGAGPVMVQIPEWNALHQILP